MVCLILPALAGCASVRSDFTAATGEKLTVYDKAVRRTGTEQVQSGVDEIRGSKGELLGTSTRYQDRETHWTAHDWYALQGGVRVDDESFFRITGDEGATAAFKEYHESGVSRSGIGELVTALGVGLVAAGAAGFVLDKPKTDPVTHQTSGGGFRTLGGMAMGVGGFMTVGGLIAFFTGVSKAHSTDARVVDDPKRARVDARRYNEKAGLAEEGSPPAPASRPGPRATMRLGGR